MSFRLGRREGWYPANTDAHLSTTHAPGVFGVIGSSRSALGVLGIVPGDGGGTNGHFRALSPPLRHTSSTPSRAAAPVCGALVPSERQWATQRPRSGGVRAPRTVEPRAGRTTAPAASCCGVMGGGAAPTTRAACAARARLSAEGHRARRCPSTTAPHRPAAPGRRVASRFDRRRCGRACTDMRRGAGHASGSGKDRCARCACRDRPGAPWGSNPNRRLPCGDHLARARALALAVASPNPNRPFRAVNTALVLQHWP